MNITYETIVAGEWTIEHLYKFQSLVGILWWKNGIYEKYAMTYWQRSIIKKFIIR